MATHQQPGQGGQSSYQQVPSREHTTIYMGDPGRGLFNTKDIRSKFVSKVYSILFLQILVATVLVAWFTLHEPTKEYFQGSGALWLYLALGIGMITYLVLICVESSRRSFPLNFILLAVITVAWGIIAAIFSARYQTVTVLSAFGATALATLVVFLMAKYSPFDLTTCGCALCILGLVHMIVGIILVIVLVPAGYASTAGILIAASGAFLVSLYLMFDLQLIMGGRQLELSPEEYILASVMLYIDIIQIFQYMLILFGSRE